MTIWLWHGDDGWYWTYDEAVAKAHDWSKSHGPYRFVGTARGVAKRHWATPMDDYIFVEVP
jgi:hypothetical protein